MGLVRTPKEMKKREQNYAQGSMVGDTKFLFASFLTDPSDTMNRYAILMVE
jgi:hypothetical protein